MISQFFLTLLLATSTLAVPLNSRQTCSVPSTALNLQPPFSPLSSPPRFVTLGFGVQNYICDSSGKYSSVGAVADLLDISCLYGTAEFAEIQDDVFEFWQKYNNDTSDSDLINELLYEFNTPLIGYHYFINDTGTPAPKFDFTSVGPTKGNPDAFVVGTKAADVPAPNSARDIDWLELKAVSGKVADVVFRVETREGRPPTSCVPGSGPISVKYAAQYWFEGGSL